MRTSSTFLAVVLIVVGTVILVGNLLGVEIWGLVWAAFLILVGLWVLWGALYGRRAVHTDEVTIPLEGAQTARLHLRHAAGRLHLGGGTTAGELLAGSFGGGVEHSERRAGDSLEVDLRVPPENFVGFAMPWTWPGGLIWSVRLSDALPLSLDIGSGAGEMRLDLTDLRVSDLKVEAGAGKVDLHLPSKAGETKVDVRAGAGSVTVTVPEGVAARIQCGGAITDARVDRRRFPRSGGLYQSPDYDAATNRVDLRIEMAVGSAVVR